MYVYVCGGEKRGERERRTRGGGAADRPPRERGGMYLYRDVLCGASTIEGENPSEWDLKGSG